MSPRPKNSTREKTAEKREKILESAMDTFAEKGFDGANMRQIASAAGVNKFMLYYHFEDKMTLFEQVLDSLTKPVFARITGAIGDADTLTVALENVFDIYSEMLSMRGGKVRSFVSRELAAGAPRIGPMLRIKGPEIVRLWEPKLTAHLGQEELPYQDVVRAVVFIMTTFVTTFLTEPVTKNVFDVYGLTVGDHEHRQQIINMVIGGIEHHFSIE